MKKDDEARPLLRLREGVVVGVHVPGFEVGLRTRIKAFGRVTVVDGIVTAASWGPFGVGSLLGVPDGDYDDCFVSEEGDVYAPRQEVDTQFYDLEGDEENGDRSGEDGPEHAA